MGESDDTLEADDDMNVDVSDYRLSDEPESVREIVGQSLGLGIEEHFRIAMPHWRRPPASTDQDSKAINRARAHVLFFAERVMEATAREMSKWRNPIGQTIPLDDPDIINLAVERLLDWMAGKIIRKSTRCNVVETIDGIQWGAVRSCSILVFLSLRKKRLHTAHGVVLGHLGRSHGIQEAQSTGHLVDGGFSSMSDLADRDAKDATTIAIENENRDAVTDRIDEIIETALRDETGLALGGFLADFLCQAPDSANFSWLDGVAAKHPSIQIGTTVPWLTLGAWLDAVHDLLLEEATKSTLAGTRSAKPRLRSKAVVKAIDRYAERHGHPVPSIADGTWDQWVKRARSKMTQRLKNDS